MDASRVVPEGLKIREKARVGVWPAFAFLYIALNGLFNFTTVWEIFAVSAMAAAVAVFCLAFVSRYGAYAVFSDPLSLAVLFWCLLVCVSIAWSVVPQRAFYSFVAYAGSLFLYFIARAAVYGGKAVPLLRAVGYAGGLIALISVEMASTGFTRTLMFELIPAVFRHAPPFGLWVEGARMQSLLGLPNIYATFAAMCFFAMLAAVPRESGTLKPRAADTIMLAANGTGFFLANSRGGFLAFAAAFLMLAVFTKKEERRRSVLVHGAIVLWCAGTALLMQVWMGTGSYAVWPVLGLSAYAAHVLIRVFSAWTGKLETVRVKTVVIALSAAAVLFAAYMTAALNVRTAFPLDKPDARLTRAVALRPGEYTLTARMDVWDGGAGAYITVDALNPRQAAARTPSVLYQGRVTAAEFAVPFTVPQDAIAVHITASPLGEAGGRVSITEMTVSGEGRTAPIPLQYNLIPEAIVSRLQGVWADPNVYQRFMYWQDGLRLFAQSPIIGLGGYSFEALSNSVSDYYYVSKHTHNHYIQALTENGVLGLAAVLLTFALAFLALWRSRRDNPLIPYLAAAAGMMAAHNWVEASMQNLLVNNVFFLLLGVISGLFVKNGQPARARRARGKRVSHEAAGGERAGGGAMAKAGVILVCTTCLVCVGLLGGRLLTAAGVRRAESQGTQKALEAYRWAVATDPLNASQYKAACLIRYVADPDSGARELAQRFVSDMEGNWNTPGDCFIVGRYHLRTGNMTGAARYFERYIALGRMDSQVWDEVLAQYARFLRDAEPAQAADIIDSAARLRRYLDEVNQAALIPVSPNESLMRRVFDLI